MSVFGLIIEVVRENNEWAIHAVGEGKRRLEHDFVIPSDVSSSDIATSIADIYHELGTTENSEVKIIRQCRSDFCNHGLELNISPM